MYFLYYHTFSSNIASQHRERLLTELKRPTGEAMGRNQKEGRQVAREWASVGEARGGGRASSGQLAPHRREHRLVTPVLSYSRLRLRQMLFVAK